MNNKSGYGFLIKWLVVIGDLALINLLFFFIYEWLKISEIEYFNTKLRIIYLLLNFSYAFAIYFIPILIYQPVMFIDKVVQRSLSLVALHLILFVTCLFFLKLKTDIFPLSLASIGQRTIEVLPEKRAELQASNHCRRRKKRDESLCGNETGNYLRIQCLWILR